jgi:tetratricopeptide (TPR) repeat protein
LEILRTNPWDVPTLRALAKACAANHYNEVELRYLKNALDAKPKDAEVNRHCAESLARMGQFDQAIACWHRLEELTGNAEAAEMISRLTVAKTMGVAPGESARAPRIPAKVTAPIPPAAADPPAVKPQAPEPVAEGPDSERRQIKLNQRQLLEKQIRSHPADIQNYVNLAELHTAEHRYQEAEQLLRKALAVSGQALKIRVLLEDAQIRSAKARLQVADKRAASEKTEAARELAEQLRADLNRLELEIYHGRCEREPDNPRLRYELASRLRRAGNYREAVKLYQEARRDPKCYVAATLETGECLQQLKQYAQALHCYQSAVEKSTDLDGDRRKLSLYRAAVLAAALKKPEVAQTYLQQLVNIDSDFKDAKDRLDKLGRISDSE